MKQPFRLSDSQRRTLDHWLRQAPHRSGTEARRRFLEAVPGTAATGRSSRMPWVWAAPVAALVLAAMAGLVGVRKPQGPIAPVPDAGEPSAAVTQFVHVLSSGTVLVHVPPLREQEATR